MSEAQKRRLEERAGRYRALFAGGIPTGEIDPFLARKANTNLAAVTEAAIALQSGSYGICIDCGDEIPKRRLKLVLTAIRCVDCQSRHERG